MYQPLHHKPFRRWHTYSKGNWASLRCVSAPRRPTASNNLVAAKQNGPSWRQIWTSMPQSAKIQPSPRTTFLQPILWIPYSKWNNNPTMWISQRPRCLSHPADKLVTKHQYHRRKFTKVNSLGAVSLQRQIRDDPNVPVQESNSE